MSKQTIQVEISRDDYRSLKVSWLTAKIADALSESSSVTRIEVKQVKNK